MGEICTGIRHGYVGVLVVTRTADSDVFDGVVTTVDRRYGTVEHDRFRMSG